MKILFSIIIYIFSSAFIFLNAEDKIELQTTTIKGNTELPKILYIVSWKDLKQKKGAEQRLVLHSLFGDLFDPVKPDENIASK